MLIKSNLRLSLFFLITLFSCASTVNSYDGREVDQPGCTSFPTKISLARVWGGARVTFDIIENSCFIYVAYYDADRWLSVVQVNKCSGKRETLKMGSRFGGWDSHNSIALAFDGQNRLHISGNMHASPLVYARMNAPDELTGLAVLRPMLGVDEARSTYPNFFLFSDGALGFSYRSGGSGDGAEFINRFEGDKWVRWTAKPLFAPLSPRASVNAYHTGFVPGPDGYFHVAWVWRENPNVESNFNVNYMRSADLRVWVNSRNEVLTLPITPENAEAVDRVPQESGLLNNVRLGFDAEGRPVISYLKFDASGATQLFHAWRLPDGWHSAPATAWTFRWDFRGRGSIPSEINFSGVKVSNGRLIERVRHPSMGTKTLAYEPDTYQVGEVLPAEVWAKPLHLPHKKGPDSAVRNTQVVRWGQQGMATQAQVRRAIEWWSHPGGNRDQPRECTPVGLPCDFVSDLFLHTVPAAPNGIDAPAGVDQGKRTIQ